MGSGVRLEIIALIGERSDEMNDLIEMSLGHIIVKASEDLTV